MNAIVETRDHLVLRTGDALDVGLAIAGIGSRSYAFLIDWHIRLLIALVWLLFILVGSKLAWPIWDAWSTEVQWLVAGLPAALVYFGYHPVIELAMHGRTPGKRMAGVRLVNRQGQTPGTGALLTRNVFRLVDSLPSFYMVGLVVAGIHPRQLRLGDIAAGTVLVYEDRPSPQSIEQTAALAARPDLLPRQQELLQDLLERWKGLERDARIRLAGRLLAELGRSVAPSGNQGELDRRLHAQLSAIAAGERVGG